VIVWVMRARKGAPWKSPCDAVKGQIEFTKRFAQKKRQRHFLKEVIDQKQSPQMWQGGERAGNSFEFIPLERQHLQACTLSNVTKGKGRGWKSGWDRCGS